MILHLTVAVPCHKVTLSVAPPQSSDIRTETHHQDPAIQERVDFAIGCNNHGDQANFEFNPMDSEQEKLARIAWTATELPMNFEGKCLKSRSAEDCKQSYYKEALSSGNMYRKRSDCFLATGSV
ncbi:hypothetical protein Nepgr_010165 [Nepenthes gracilis]|uniref:Uncharacterized protein n=1 Tax=Nepenthes gracilis TaxID=150966 RepID=A0AAD3XL25_NEPGR|nr:hypothetical protein Nepgr_010165 [Nepenthes gracilis]